MRRVAHRMAGGILVAVFTLKSVTPPNIVQPWECVRTTNRLSSLPRPLSFHSERPYLILSSYKYDRARKAKTNPG